MEHKKPQAHISQGTPSPRTGGSRDGGNRNPHRSDRRPRRDEGPRNEFEQKMLGVRRVTRVVAGGRRLSFSVSMIIGDRKGRVGLGIGKAVDTALAITKAVKAAKKNMIKVNTTKTMSIPFEITSKFCASSVTLTPNKGRGLVAGSSVRDLLALAGLKDISGKIHSGSKNKLNNARAAYFALKTLGTPVIEKVKETDKAEELIGAPVIPVE